MEMQVLLGKPPKMTRNVSSRQVFVPPFDVTRAHDEASGIRDPRIWTAERDQQMWHALQQG